jgi:ribosomal protein S18 acetylase RimI-like enzyme
METINIEEAGLKEIPTLQSIAEIAFRATYKEILTPGQMEYMMDWMYSEKSLLQQMTADNHTFQIGYDAEGKAVGYVSVQPEGESAYHLQKIYLLPEAQGKGYGRQLFDAAVNYIKSVHPAPCVMRLNVNRHNKALDFYRHMGMKQVDEGDFSIGHGYYMNDYIMALDI